MLNTNVIAGYILSFVVVGFALAFASMTGSAKVRNEAKGMACFGIFSFHT